MSDDRSADPSPAPAPARAAGERPREAGGTLDGFDDWSRKLESTAAIATATVAVVANIKLFFEQRWTVALAIAIACVAGFGLYYFLTRRARINPPKARLLRRFAVIPLICVSALSIFAFVALALWPRAYEDGPIIAIAHFEGPTLPAPYQQCRPSDMLADKLTDVAQRYSHLTVFELPYVINPDGRWAKLTARLHAFIEGVDTVVYGEYSFIDDANSEAGKPDRLLISPEADQIPLPVPQFLRPLWDKLPHMRAPILPVGAKTAPLQQWEFPERILRIEDLCAGTAQRFLGDGARLGLAFVGLQSFAAHEYVAAERARSEAEGLQSRDIPPEQLFATNVKADNARCDGATPAASNCSGVLAFYLGALSQRMGQYGKAEREYKFAAIKLNRPEPWVNFAELAILRNERGKALEALRLARLTDPKSLVATATLARYEREAGFTEESKLDLDRARSLAVPASSEYGKLSLCRAIYGFSKHEGLQCRPEYWHDDSEPFPDAAVEHGRWLRDAAHQAKDKAAAAFDSRLAIREFQRVLDRDPYNVGANYFMALTLADTTPPGESLTRRREHYRQALVAPAFTDEQLTNQGNAAADIGEFGRALDRYGKALHVNSNAAYTYRNRGNVYWRMRNFRLALRDLQIAARLHPTDCKLASTIAALSSDEKPSSVSDRKAGTGVVLRIAQNR